MFKACIGFRSRRVEYLDKTHCSLARIPEEVYRNERWLEELILDMNMIQELPPVSKEHTKSRALNRYSIVLSCILTLSPWYGSL